MTTQLSAASHQSIQAWKDHQRRDLDNFFAGVMYRAVLHIAAECRDLLADRSILVVPAPSRASSNRRRGTVLTRHLGEATVRAWQHAGYSAQLLPVMRIGAGESRRASARKRWEETSVSLRAGFRIDPAGKIVFLVDDVLTTGATLAKCCDALEKIGLGIAGAAVLAARQKG